MSNTIAHFLQYGQALLSHSSTPALDVQVLLAELLQQPRSFLFAHPEYILSDADSQTFQQWLNERAKGVPVAYLLGYKEFWDLRLTINSDVLIPRPETECLIEQLLSQFPHNSKLRVIDLGTGSGAIALTLAKARPHWEITASDQSAAALAVAKNNASELGLSHIHWIGADWLTPFRAACFDLIISNPPYLAAEDPHLKVSDIRYEPQTALVAGKAGLQSLIRISHQALTHIRPAGWLFLEHSCQQQAILGERLHCLGWKNINYYQDLAGLPRFTSAQYL